VEGPAGPARSALPLAVPVQQQGLTAGTGPAQEQQELLRQGPRPLGVGVGPLRAQLLLLLLGVGAEEVPLQALLHPLAAWGLPHPSSWGQLLLLLLLRVLVGVPRGDP
jgi:hypothetical protein